VGEKGAEAVKEASIEIGMPVRLPKFGKEGQVWEIIPQAGAFELMVVVIRERDGRQIEVHPREIVRADQIR
jgi:hypothetical protein